MRNGGVRRTTATVGVVVALLVGLLAAAGATAEPAGAAGLTLEATTAATGLKPGSKVTVRISGAAAGQTVRYGVCATSVACAPASSVKANGSGVATVTLTLAGTATYANGATTGVKACRPDRCFVAAHPNGRPTPLATLPLRFVGERVSATIQPTVGLVDGQTVFVTGRVRGAEGRTVRAVQAKPACGPTCGATLGQATVRADGTFSLQGPARRMLPFAGGSCAPAPGAAATTLGPCQVEVSVVGDPSHGIASALVRFLATGVPHTVTPRFDLVDRQQVRVTGSGPGLVGRTVRVRQWACDSTDPFGPICVDGPTVTGTIDPEGRLSTILTVRRMVGTLDCAASRHPVPDCTVEVTVLTSRGAPDTTFAAHRTAIYFAPR